MYDINWYRLDEHREISDFITCAEYQLFIDEMRLQNKFYQPAHWINYQFPKGQALQPILGIYGEDAQAFCDWLNRKKNNDITYRLPTLEESRSFVPQGSFEIANWSKNNNKFSLCWNDKYYLAKIKTHCATFSDLPVIFLEYNSFTSIPAPSIVKGFAKCIDLNFSRNFTTDLEGGLTSIIEHAVSNLKQKTKLSIHHIVFTYNYELARIISHNLSMFPTIAFNADLKKRGYKNALQLIKNKIELHNYSDTEYKRLILINLIIELLDSEHNPYAMVVWQSYIKVLTAYIYKGLTQLNKQEIGWWEFWKIDNYDKDKQLMLNLHWWSVITNARMEGKLPAWEGLRIVREKKFD